MNQKSTVRKVKSLLVDTIRVKQSLKVDSALGVIIVRVIYSKKDLGGHAQYGGS